MRSKLISMWALFVAVFVLVLGIGLLGTLVSLRLTVMGYGSIVIGAMTTAYYAGQVCGAFIAPSIVGRIGHIKSFAALAAATTIFALLHALYMDPVLWGMLRLATGISMVGLYMVTESWLNYRSDSTVRGRVFSVYMMTTFLGLGAGQFLLGVGHSEDQTLFVVAAILFATSLIPVTFTRTEYPPPAKKGHIRIRKLFKLAPLGVWGCFGAGLASGAFFALGPTYGIRVGLNVNEVAWLMGVTIVGGMALQWPVGLLSDHFDRQRVVGALYLVEVGVCLAIAFVGGQSLAGLLVAAAAFGGLTFATYPVAVAHVNDHIEAKKLVPASAALILVYGVGAALGPLGAAGMMFAFGPQGLFAFAALVAFVIGLAATFTPRRKPIVPEAQSHFVAMPYTSAGAAELDPRAEHETNSTG